MTPHELTAAWLRMPSPGSGDFHRLADVGVTGVAVHRSGGLAMARARVSGALWSPDAVGRPMLVTPVWNGPAPSIFWAVEHAMVVDLIAWMPTEPDAMYRRTGAGSLLGEEYVGHGLAGEPIRLFSSILDWLRAGCTGIVPLDYLIGGHAAGLEEAA